MCEQQGRTRGIATRVYPDPWVAGFFKAYVLREHLDHLWTYKTPRDVETFLEGWLKALRGSGSRRWNAWARSWSSISMASSRIVIIRCASALSSRSTPPSRVLRRARDAR
jgi:hypothetical protein